MQMSYLHTLSRDEVTVIVSYLSNQDRMSLLAADCDLSQKIDWMSLYQEKYSPLYLNMKEIHSIHFPITKKEQIDAMITYYNAINCDDDSDDDEYRHTIPIINSDVYKLEDYVWSVEDEIYDDIRICKMQSTIENREQRYQCLVCGCWFQVDNIPGICPVCQDWCLCNVCGIKQEKERNMVRSYDNWIWREQRCRKCA
jgi:hypothetical protein